MTEPRWIDPATVMVIHDEQLAEHGGLAGVRDMGLLESALARPQSKWSFGEEDVPKLAAAYAFGIARNHPFLDGNKRTALVVSEAFIDMNGYALLASDVECLTTFLMLAAGEMSEEQLADWFTEHARPLSKPA